MTISVAVSGATGYAGGEVIRMLAQHPQARVRTVTAHSQAGALMGEVAPHLFSVADQRLQPTDAEHLAGHDVVVLALPHGASAEVAAQLPAETLVIDAGADHRLEDPAAWARFYGGEHAGSWPYGLPELPLAGGGRQREHLVGARRVAVPGCYPTSAQLALAPGVAAGLIQAQDVVVVSASGLSGAGKSAKVHLLGAETMSSMSPYAVGGVHRHIPEIEQGLAWAGAQEPTVGFTPTLAPMPRGILTTATARMDPEVAARPDAEDVLRQAWAQAYAEEPFVNLLPAGQWPATQSVQGTNHAQMQLAADRHTGRVIVVCAIDNLGKGTAGAAVQSMNIALGLAETAGLGQEGLAP